jgi:hypothetical protein
MDITKEMLSVLKLTALSLLTFIRTLPAIIIVYLIPALAIVFFVSPHVSDVPLLIAKQASPSHLTYLMVFKQVIARPEVFLSLVLFAAVYIYAITFTYLYTEGILNRVKAGLYYVIPQSVLAFPRFIAAIVACAGVIFLFLSAPYIPAFFTPLTPALSLGLFLLWWLALIFVIFFIFTGIFFGRVAVLRNKWPRGIFYYSYKLVYGRGLKLLVYLIIISFINAVLLFTLKLFMPVLLGIFASSVGADKGGAAIPYAIALYVGASFYYSVALTTYFLNMDYMLNRDNKKMELFSRVAAINDNSMPVLK